MTLEEAMELPLFRAGWLAGISNAAMAAADEAEHWNNLAYDKRQSGKDDNFACAAASGASRSCERIKKLPPVASPPASVALSHAVREDAQAAEMARLRDGYGYGDD